MIVLSFSIRIPAADEAEAKELNEKILNAVKDLKDISVSSVMISPLTKPRDIKK